MIFSKTRLGLLFLIGIIGICLYYLYNPEGSTWFPKCWFHALTGWECPACGVQRALHALLHGDVRAAIGYNAFLLLASPYLLLLLYTTASRSDTSARLRKYVQHRYTVRIYLVLIVVWWIVRNWLQ